MSNNTNTLTPEHRADLIGETVTEIIKVNAEIYQLKEKYGAAWYTNPEAQEKVDYKDQLDFKLRYLKCQELYHLEHSLELLKIKISRCSPGEWVELEGLKEETESKIKRIRKELTSV